MCCYRSIQYVVTLSSVRYYGCLTTKIAFQLPLKQNINFWHIFDNFLPDGLRKYYPVSATALLDNTSSHSFGILNGNQRGWKVFKYICHNHGLKDFVLQNYPPYLRSERVFLMFRKDWNGSWTLKSAVLRIANSDEGCRVWASTDFEGLNIGVICHLWCNIF